MKLFLKKQLFFQGIFIAIFAIFLDLFTKNLVYFYLHNQQNYFTPYPRIAITNFFNLVYVNNNGISFGMFDQVKNAREIFAILQGGIAIFIISWLWRVNARHLSYALGLIIGGAFGNVIDRIFNGGVTDFLDFYIASYHWPAFNLADSFIFIGVCIILFDEFFIKKK